MCHVSCVMCHVSCVMGHMSCVTCPVSHVKIFFYIFYRKKKYITIFFFVQIGQSGGASRWRVCYHWGLPRLVFLCYSNIFFAGGSRRWRSVCWSAAWGWPCTRCSSTSGAGGQAAAGGGQGGNGGGFLMDHVVIEGAVVDIDLEGLDITLW